jgi:hypothetical protein
MLNLTINKEGLVFTSSLNGHNVHFREWVDTDDCIYYFPLATLVDNGCATYNKDCCILPFENVYLLDDDEKAILGIPKKYDKAIMIHSDGTLNSSEFKYKVVFLTHAPDGQILINERFGNIIFIGKERYLLSQDQFYLLEKVEAFNALEEKEKTVDNNLRRFAEIKELAIKSGCVLDGYLNNENVFSPDRIKIEITQDNEGYSINPSVPIKDSDKFKRTFEKMRKVQNVYPISNENGERTRVVLSSEQKRELNVLKENGGQHRTKEEIIKIAKNPTEYFDPDLFDLSDFYSDRVVEIGIYKPKFYPFICPYKSCWIAGATIETPQNGTSKINIKDEIDLDELVKSISEAEATNKDIIVFKDTQIDINDAKFLAEIATKQFDSPKKPIDTSSKEHEVLIIEDNAEVLGFTESIGSIEREDKYTFSQDPYLINSFKLKEHQEEGIAWLQHLYKEKASGCLLADDMGLGKTLQILYFIDWHSRNYSQHNPYLIVAPVSLLENWENEYAKFFKEPRLNITKLTSRDIPRQFDKKSIDYMQTLGIILTNYESLRISQLNFCAVQFDVIVLDEAQKIKSPGTLVTNAAKALKGNFKVAITGTPVENSLLDLWCIMDFCVPGLLGNAKTFASLYQNPLKKEDTDLVALGNEIHEKLGLYFTRRLKSDVAKDLPEKQVIKEFCDMPSVQERAYKQAINEYLKGIKSNMLVTIMNMKQISEHPYLYDSSLFSHEISDIIESSARLMKTLSFIDRIQNKNEKVIVFAERKETQKMLQQIFYERYGLITKIINGDTPPYVPKGTTNRLSRQSSINEFQSRNGFNIIIMSPIAAGTGLNVTAANHVIHYSRHWNPAKENQATDRAYRIGQDKKVFVYYPIAVCKDIKSFDITLDELLSRKTSLATNTIYPTERIEVKPEELGSMLFNK